ncbi:dihydrolipoamide acetyltransferase family protein [Pelosinus sp. sgz500959]|uniref:dihydrolipoamide acetyltransferase family protein n=1 Tax=Pelosinus sp. sgz500959 TaxID=3242472 RepID=UPI00366CD76C
MAVEITMPKMGLSMVTGTIVKWLKQEGDAVSKGDIVLEVMTDKLTNTIDAPADGVLLKIVAQEEEELPIGALLGIIGMQGEAVQANAKAGTIATSPPEISITEARNLGTTNEVTGNRVKASPLARKLAKENNIDFTQIVGTGPSGRIIRDDLIKFIADGGASKQVRLEQKIEVPEPDTMLEQDSFTLTPYAGMRKAVGDNMSHSWSVAPKVNYHVSADLSALLALRKTINEEAEAKITITDMLVKIVAVALKRSPHINSALVDKNIRTYKDVHIGVAVAINQGLVVPVVKNADIKTISQVSREIKELSLRARDNKLSMNEMRGGTFTVTNIGTYQSVDWFTPIINQPEAAILGVGRTVDTPVVENGEIVIRPMIGLSLSFDHRIIDGAPAAEFLGLLLKLIKKPYQALI